MFSFLLTNWIVLLLLQLLLLLPLLLLLVRTGDLIVFELVRLRVETLAVISMLKIRLNSEREREREVTTPHSM